MRKALKARVTGLIYHLFCLDTGKCYVGQTWGTLEERWKGHLKDARGSRSQQIIHRALRKHGQDRFITSCLTSGLKTQKEMDDAEIYWGLHFNALVPGGYNLKLGEAHGLCSEELRIKMSEAQVLSQARPEVKARARAIQKVVQNKPEIVARRQASMLKTASDPKWREKQSVNSKLQWMKPEVRERNIVSLIIAQNKPEVVAQRSASLKVALNLPGAKRNQRAAATLRESMKRRIRNFEVMGGGTVLEGLLPSPPKRTRRGKSEETSERSASGWITRRINQKRAKR